MEQGWFTFPKQVKSEGQAKKVMASVVWNSKNCLVIYHYCNLLKPGLGGKKSFFLKIVHPLIMFLAMAELNEIKYEFLEHPPFSPYFAASDHYLLRNLKQLFREKHFSSNEVVELYFAELPENHYRDAINYCRIFEISVFKWREIKLNIKTDFIQNFIFFHFCF